METAILIEASKYDPMFGEMISMFPNYGSEIQTMINWARHTLKREDRIIWFLRWYRLILLNNSLSQVGASAAQDPTQTEFMTRLNNVFRKYAAQQSKITGKPVDESTLAKYGSTRNIQGGLSHSLSLPALSIQNLQFSSQTPEELDSQIKELEEQWKVEQAEKAQHLDAQEGDEVLIDFQDGWAWWLLNRGSCDAEANAMGHCGNGPSERQGDRILSLRKQGPMGWRPSLTFILNGDGKLGEMKGRGNDKPAPQYYPYIVKLLENPIIQGIRGGGYMPEHNFMMSDLPPEEQERLMELKPGLASAGYLLKKFGPTDEFGAKMIEEMEATLEGNVDTPTWDSEKKVFVIQTFKDVDAFVDTYGSDFLKRVAGNFNGRGESFFDDMDHGGDRSAKDLYDDLPPEILAKIAKYAFAEYGQYQDDEDFDWSDADEIWSVLYDNDDGVVEAMKQAASTGYRFGAEAEMHDAFVSTLTDGFEGTDADYLDVEYTMFQDEKGKEHIAFDGPCRITLPPLGAVEVVDKGMLGEIADQGWTQDAEIGIEEPHYGWSGYDEAAAKEDAEERLHWEAAEVFNY